MKKIALVLLVAVVFAAGLSPVNVFASRGETNHVEYIISGETENSNLEFLNAGLLDFALNAVSISPFKVAVGPDYVAETWVFKALKNDDGQYSGVIWTSFADGEKSSTFNITEAVVPVGYEFVKGEIQGGGWQGSYGFCRIEIRKIGGSTALSPSPAPVKLTANPTVSTVIVNGQSRAFDAYNINDNNYFKLRDLAFVLNNSVKQFSVDWEEATKTISLRSGYPYAPVGGEMGSKGNGAKTPTLSNSKLLLDGNSVSFTSYNIGGNNYFKLRDIGSALNFAVDWDGASNTITIDTNKSYV
jgi:hypothetical protein